MGEGAGAAAPLTARLAAGWQAPAGFSCAVAPAAPHGGHVRSSHAEQHGRP